MSEKDIFLRVKFIWIESNRLDNAEKRLCNRGDWITKKIIKIKEKDWFCVCFRIFLVPDELGSEDVPLKLFCLRIKASHL